MRTLLKNSFAKRFRKALVLICLLIFSFNTSRAIETIVLDGEEMELVTAVNTVKTWVYWFPEQNFANLDTLEPFIPFLPDWLGSDVGGGGDPDDDNQINQECLDAIHRFTLATSRVSQYQAALERARQQYLTGEKSFISPIDSVFAVLVEHLFTAQADLNQAQADMDTHCP